MERRSPESGTESGSAALWLQPLASLYGAVTAAGAGSTRQAVPAYRVGRPVIVVGNLTVGGTGKTPLVAWLAEKLTERRLSVGILSRGYGSSGSRPPRTSSHRQTGATSATSRCCSGSERSATSSSRRIGWPGARELIERRVDVILADDGLQHLRLARDCEIVVVDGARGFGNGRLLPAGPLREPVSRARARRI